MEQYRRIRRFRSQLTDFGNARGMTSSRLGGQIVAALNLKKYCVSSEFSSHNKHIKPNEAIKRLVLWCFDLNFSVWAEWPYYPIAQRIVWLMHAYEGIPNLRSVCYLCDELWYARRYRSDFHGLRFVCCILEDNNNDNEIYLYSAIKSI